MPEEDTVVISPIIKITDAKEKKRIIPYVIPSPVLVYTDNVGRSRAAGLMWEVPEWDLAETGRILDVESFVRRAFRNKKNLFLKEGYEFTGANPDRVDYIKRRFQQMEMATGVPFPILIGQTIWSLIRQSNAFWVKQRDYKASGGQRRKDIKTKKSLQPIAGYFLAPAETIKFKRDAFGKILRYRQEAPNKPAVEFDPQDVIHFYLDKREGYAVGTPVLTSVKDDIRALRRIEENVEMLVYQHLFPLFHYKVGTEKAPAATYSDGTTEVQTVKAKVQNMPTDGCWVTPERHEIKAVGAEGEALAVDKIIAHFKQRIYTGLGQSSVDMGEGATANKSTAQTMSRNLVDDTKMDQQDFGAQFYSFVIQELLLESTFSPETLFDNENRVFLKFKEIDFEARHAKENHYADLFLKNTVTHGEMRMAMGYEPFIGEGWTTNKASGDWQETNYGLIERDKIILQSVDEPGTEESKTVANAAASSKPTASPGKALPTRKKNIKSAGGNSIANKNRPANQHGTRPSAKVNKDWQDRLNRSGIVSLDSIFLQRSEVLYIYNLLSSDVQNKVQREGVNIKDIDILIGMSFSEARDRLTTQARQAFRTGLRDANTNPWEIDLERSNSIIGQHIDRYTSKLRDDLIRQIDRHTLKDPRLIREDIVFIQLIFNALNVRARMIDDSEIMRAYNYGKAYGYVVHNQEAQLKRNDNVQCDICDRHTLSYNNINDILYEGLAPLHPFCCCTYEAVD